MLWGFIMGEEGLKFGNIPKGLKWAIGIFIIIAVLIAVLWAAGVDTAEFFDRIFNANWSNTFWTNLVFIVLVVAALVIVLATGKAKT